MIRTHISLCKVHLPIIRFIKIKQLFVIFQRIYDLGAQYIFLKILVLNSLCRGCIKISKHKQK